MYFFVDIKALYSLYIYILYLIYFLKKYVHKMPLDFMRIPKNYRSGGVRLGNQSATRNTREGLFRVQRGIQGTQVSFGSPIWREKKGQPRSQASKGRVGSRVQDKHVTVQAAGLAGSKAIPQKTSSLEKPITIDVKYCKRFSNEHTIWRQYLGFYP